MALAYKIKKDAYDKLSDDMKKEYREKDGDYVLDVSGIDDPAELRRARDREKEDAAAAKKEAKELRDRLEAIEGDDARKTGDIKKIEATWQGKLDAANQAAEATIGKLKKHIERVSKDGVADTIATKISKVPSLIARVIKDRLTVDMDGDEPKTIVLDAAGKPTAMTLVDLEKEIVANKEYADIIVASKASGGGAPRDNKPGGAGPAINPSDPAPDLAKLPPSDLVAQIKARKAANAGA